MSLLEACQHADIERVKSLIEQQCDLMKVDDQGRTALHYCSDHSNTDCASLLLADESIRRSILNLKDNEGCSALCLACLDGNTTLVKYLCEQGADVKLADHESHSLIHWITVCGHWHLFDILLSYGAPVQTADVYGAFPIHYASQLCGNENSVQRLAVLKKLIDHNDDVDCLDQQRRTPFLWAASAGAVDALRILYKAGANPLSADKDSLNALHCAATRGHASCVRMLVELYECPVDAEDINGCTALFYAISLQHPAVCQTLLEMKANPNHQDNRGRTPSHCAALKGDLDCLKQLITHNADIWVKNKRGDYPLHEAVSATVHSKVRDMAKQSSSSSAQFSDVVRYILHAHPKKLNIRNGEDRTPLHLAASLGDVSMCQVLIECGARVNSFMRTAAGNFITPYDLAQIRRRDACADYLATTHGGQRGNLLANIFARRIQNFLRQSKGGTSPTVNLRRQLFAITARTTTHQTIRASSSARSSVQIIPITQCPNVLLAQAKTCLDNKIVEDRLRQPKKRSSRRASYLLDSPNEDEKSVQQRRKQFSYFPATMPSMNFGADHLLNAPDKIIIQTSNSIATSVKLYERHKLIAEELFKLKQARIHNHDIIINRPLYKILIENAFNPTNRHVEEIEKYLETLLRAYETELDAIRKRTKSVPTHRQSKASMRR